MRKRKRSKRPWYGKPYRASIRASLVYEVGTAAWPDRLIPTWDDEDLREFADQGIRIPRSMRSGLLERQREVCSVYNRTGIGW